MGEERDMTEKRAKEIIRTPGYPNVMEALEAKDVAIAVLGDDMTAGDMYRWAEQEDGEDEEIDTVAVH